MNDIYKQTMKVKIKQRETFMIQWVGKIEKRNDICTTIL